MSEAENPLTRAIEQELVSAHGVQPDEAALRAPQMEPGLRRRFSTWVRRELIIQRKGEHAVRRESVRNEVVVGGGRQFERLSLNIRLQHGLMALSVLVLIASGLPLKFHEHAWAKAIIDALGGPDSSPLIHRGAATLLIAVGLWHLGYITLTREGRGNFGALLPRPQDALDAFKQIGYYLGRSDDRPRFDRFSYVEKFDYWAVYWGMVIMIGSGTMLWFTSFFLRFLPKWVTDIAKEAHSDEALLATLAIIIWHFYNVHLNPHKFPMNRTFLTGKISEREMIEEHPLEYERMMRQRAAMPTAEEHAEAAEGEP